MKKKRLRSMLAMALSCVLVMPAAAIGTATAAAADDADGHWAERELRQWSERGWLQGYGEGQYGPDRDVSRAEWMTFINRSFGLTAEAEVSYGDLNAGDWAYRQVRIAAASGYIDGYPDGTIRADQSVSRQEAAVSLAKLLKLKPEQAEGQAAADFADASSLAAWSRDAVGALAAAGILTGYPDRTYGPDKHLTRAEAVVTLGRALAAKGTVYDAAGMYGPESGSAVIAGNAVVQTAGVTLRNLVIEGDLLLAAGIGEGDVTLDGVTVRGTVTVAGGGANSVHLKNSVLVNVIVDKKTGEVRIVAEGKTTVGQIKLASGAKLEAAAETKAAFKLVQLAASLPSGSRVTLSGEFETVELLAKQIAIEVPSGKIGKLSAAAGADNAELKLGKDAEIVSLVLEAVMKVLGQGKIGAAELADKAKASTFETKPQQMSGAGAPSGGGGPVFVGGGSGGGSTADTTAPALHVRTVGPVEIGQTVQAASSEAGMIYLVKQQTTAQHQHLVNMSVLPYGARATVTAGTYAELPTAGLQAGTYVLYAEDAALNLSPASAAIELTAPQTSFTLSTSAFADGGAIPAKYAFLDGNSSIPLQWEGAPQGTQSYALLMWDEDANGFVHWFASGIPAATGSLAEGASGTAEMPAGSVEHGNHFIEKGQVMMGYGGPQPPAQPDPATGTHHYNIRLFALDVPSIEVPDQFMPAQSILELLEQHAIDSVTLSGTYFIQSAPELTGYEIYPGGDPYSVEITYEPAEGHVVKMRKDFLSGAGNLWGLPVEGSPQDPWWETFTSGADVPGLFPGRAVYLYEIDAEGKVVKAARIMLGTEDVAAPSFGAVGFNGDTIEFSFDGTDLFAITAEIEISTDGGVTWAAAVPERMDVFGGEASLKLPNLDQSYQFRLVLKERDMKWYIYPSN